MQAPATL